MRSFQIERLYSGNSKTTKVDSRQARFRSKISDHRKGLLNGQCATLNRALRMRRTSWNVYSCSRCKGAIVTASCFGDTGFVDGLPCSLT